MYDTQEGDVIHFVVRLFVFFSGDRGHLGVSRFHVHAFLSSDLHCLDICYSDCVKESLDQGSSPNTSFIPALEPC